MPETKKTGKGPVRELLVQLERPADEAIKTWKAGARRRDAVGELSYRSLELVHRGLGMTARQLARLEKATAPPVRPAKPAVTPAHRAPARHTEPRGAAS